MPNINISVVDKIATNTSPGAVIVCGNSGYTVTFDFDSEWGAEPDRVARFVPYRNGVRLTHQELPFTGATVAVPVLEAADSLQVGVYVKGKLATTPAAIPCDRSILCMNNAKQA